MLMMTNFCLLLGLVLLLGSVFLDPFVGLLGGCLGVITALPFTFL